MNYSTKLLSFILVFNNAFSQENNTRQSFEIKLAVDDSSFYNVEMKNSPIVIGDSLIQLYPNEKKFIEADIVNWQLKNLRVVDKIKHAQKTLIFEFKQMTDGRKHQQMFLVITNPFKRILYYNAQIYLPEYKKWINTEVSPIKAKNASYEMWSDLITTIVIKCLHI